MVRPKHFGFDEESAESNVFQNRDGADNRIDISTKALEEFDAAVDALRGEGVNVIVVEDTDIPIKPNAVFPNNWISFHEDKVITYPMMAVNRRAERREDIIGEVEQQGFSFSERVDISGFESEDKFLESTGSIIFDYDHSLAYACISERTHPHAMDRLCSELNYHAILFHSNDKSGFPIYHTNVMMCLADHFAVICLESIPEDERKMVTEKLEQTGHEIIKISYDQMYAFAGNMLQVKGDKDETILVMSEAAIQSLSSEQKDRLSQYSKLLSIPIPTIEKYGGGSIRCMMCRVS